MLYTKERQLDFGAKLLSQDPLYCKRHATENRRSLRKKTAKVGASLRKFRKSLQHWYHPKMVDVNDQFFRDIRTQYVDFLDDDVSIWNLVFKTQCHGMQDKHWIRRGAIHILMLSRKTSKYLHPQSYLGCFWHERIYLCAAPSIRYIRCFRNRNIQASEKISKILMFRWVN